VTSRIALGTAQFGLDYGVANSSGRVSYEDVSLIVSKARSHGLRMLDTAVAYGQSEAILGQIGVSEWQVVSKLPEIPDGTEDIQQWVENQVQGSLQRLRIPRLYALLLHRPDQILGSFGKRLINAMKAVKVQGLIEKFGVSVYSPGELEELFRSFDFDVVQAPLNILDRRLLDSGWAKRLQSAGVELHARSVFLQGLLLFRNDERPQKFRRWHEVWAAWDNWLTQNSLTPLEGCLSYVYSMSDVNQIVVGVDKTRHLDEIIAASRVECSSFPDWPKSIDVELVNPSFWGKL